METGTAVLIGAVGLGAAYLFLNKNNAQASAVLGVPVPMDGGALAPQATSGSGQGALDSLYSTGGGVAGGIIGSVYGGQAGSAAGKAVGTAIGKPIGRVTQSQLTTQAKTTVQAVKSLGSGVADLAKGNISGGAAKIVSGSIKAGAAPITSTIHALKSLW